MEAGGDTLLESISLPSSIVLWKSQDYIFEPLFTPQDATNLSLIWDCNDTSVISIDQDGNVTAKAIGAAKVTATSVADNSVQASATVIVDREITQIVVGGYHSVILDSKGDLWTTGANDKGQLGIGDNNDSHSFVKVKSIGAMEKR
ncbi:MAG: Ig-like domain-containing protein [Helicobacteraceae bacterium]|jgi:alpha-tubulin suppressor-like RCC1 family protein|nr:Ig-like domain-containing protein [Helicobacteraceae bacterium]